MRGRHPTKQRDTHSTEREHSFFLLLVILVGTYKSNFRSLHLLWQAFGAAKFAMEFVRANDPVVLSNARPIRAIRRGIPKDVALMIAMCMVPDRTLRGATSAVLTPYVFEEDHWDPEGISVYSLLGDPLRIPVAHQPWRTEVVSYHVFRFKATLRERELM